MLTENAYIELKILTEQEKVHASMHKMCILHCT